MNTDVMISIIGFAGVCVGAIFGYMGKSRKQAAQDAKREQEQRDSFSQIFKALEEVKKRLDEHNHYADRDVSTCGTGMAKGMMNCADENAGDDFEIYWRDSIDKIQAGDWLVFDGGMYGHVGMALGGNNNGYVALLGENQGGHSCGANVGGSATNIINISLKNLIGFYRPKAYIKPEPTPEPIPISGCVLWHVERGDTMSKIMMECEGVIKYGEIMNEYAKTWYSLIYRPNQSVYDGWNSPSGVGLYAGDDIAHRMK